jgi:hypothetical protein
MNKYKIFNKKNTFFSNSNSVKCPFISQLKFCQKLDFEASPEYSIKNPNMKNREITDPNNKHPEVN